MPALHVRRRAQRSALCGATPVLCDVVSPARLQPRPRGRRRRITPRTRAVMAVHFCGYPATWPRCARSATSTALRADRGLRPGDRRADRRRRRHAGGHGRRAGGRFSFFSKKQLCVGEGGMVMTADEELGGRVRLLRSHAMTRSTWDRHRGHAETYDIVDIGFNYRLDEPRAALGAEPPGAPGRQHRRGAARRSAPTASGWPGSTGSSCLRRPGGRALLALRLRPVFADRATPRPLSRGAERGRIQTTWYPAITSSPSTRTSGRCERAEQISQRHLALPLSSTLTADEVQRVCDMVVQALAG